MVGDARGVHVGRRATGTRGEHSALKFVSLDARLNEAAAREGFPVRPAQPPDPSRPPNKDIVHPDMLRDRSPIQVVDEGDLVES